MDLLNIKRLMSGGIITNYYCSSECRHCLYACSKKWKKDYIDNNHLANVIRKIKSLGCHSVHIGGGEPFLNIDQLKETVKTAMNENMGIDYIETNSSWVIDENRVSDLLEYLLKNNVSTLLISISPFHNEHIPFKRVKTLMKLCREIGMSIFPWMMSFYDDIDRFDGGTTHALEEYTNLYGKDYVKNIPSRYWIHLGGRAIELFISYTNKRTVEEILNLSDRCTELIDTSHFHCDLYGNYIPGLCSGLSIKHQDLGESLTEDEYPLLTMLYNEGVVALLNYAMKEYNFKAKDHYISKCHLCLDIRKYLVTSCSVESIELQPVDFYFNL